MRIAFYAPLRAPAQNAEAGGRQVAGLMMEALTRAGHSVTLASDFRSYDGEGDLDRQAALRDQGIALARRLTSAWIDAPRESRPQLWFTYHVYYKAPDWLGARIGAELGIPYVIADPSYAPKRAGGRWAIGHDAAADSIRRADLLLCPTRHDVLCIEPLVFNRERIVPLASFVDPAPFRDAAERRAMHRAALAAAHGLDPAAPWLLVSASMVPGDRRESYAALAAALAQLHALPWRLVVTGGGPAHEEIEALLSEALPGRASFLGELGKAEMPPVYAACDLCVWPAINEAYGVEMLEAQAAGTPIITCALRGVPDVVQLGRAGLLAPAGDAEALALFIRALLIDPDRRAAMGRAAQAFVASERSIDAAATRLGRALANVSGSEKPA